MMSSSTDGYTQDTEKSAVSSGDGGGGFEKTSRAKVAAETSVMNSSRHKPDDPEDVEANTTSPPSSVRRRRKGEKNKQQQESSASASASQGGTVHSVKMQDDISSSSWCCCRWWQTAQDFLLNGHYTILLLSIIIFIIFCGTSFVIIWMVSNNNKQSLEDDATDLAIETGEFFSDQLDRTILPLFSLAQFTTHLDIFKSLPEKIGVLGAPGSLPMIDGTSHRNITGVCDDPNLVEQFVDIASGVKANAKMEGIMVNIQLAPAGVICLLHPMNNTEDFEDGTFLDSTGAWGLDLFNDPTMKFIALSSIKNEEVGIAGPLQLTQCPECDPFFIARLPIVYPNHTIYVDGKPYNRWGFATALIHWKRLVEQSGIYESFAEKNLEFLLTRTDRNLNQETGLYDEKIVVLAETPSYKHNHEDLFHLSAVSVTLETTNNEWEMTVLYDHGAADIRMGIAAGVCFLVSGFIAYLIYKVLLQRQIQARMVADTAAQEAKVSAERNMTAYFAHELRNPLSALDSALRCLATEPNLPPACLEYVDGMQLCSNFMSGVMNNLLDVRKIEEGKMTMRLHTMSLKSLIGTTHSMMKTSVRDTVNFIVDAKIPKNKTWVMGDAHRIQQVLTNVTTNAIKYTMQGSITLRVSWIKSSEVDSKALQMAAANNNGELVRLEVIDTGPGIPKSEQTKLFERFVQRGGAPGTGLGLNIAKQIVELSRGSIRFESDPTVKPGTNCIILLPLELCEDQPDDDDFGSTHNLFGKNGDDLTSSTRSDGSSAAAGGANNAGGNIGSSGESSAAMRKKRMNRDQGEPIEDELSILIMDDIKMNRVMLQRRIERTIAPKATITMAENGEQALEICKTQSFDIIICDQYMEATGGVLVGTDVIIAMRRNKISSFIIGCSGNDLDKMFFDAGADIVWGKPMPTNREIITQIRLGLKISREREL